MTGARRNRPAGAPQDSGVATVIVAPTGPWVYVPSQPSINMKNVTHPQRSNNNKKVFKTTDHPATVLPWEEISLWIFVKSDNIGTPHIATNRRTTIHVAQRPYMSSSDTVHTDDEARANTLHPSKPLPSHNQHTKTSSKQYIISKWISKQAIIFLWKHQFIFVIHCRI